LGNVYDGGNILQPESPAMTRPRAKAAAANPQQTHESPPPTIEVAGDEPASTQPAPTTAASTTEDGDAQSSSRFPPTPETPENIGKTQVGDEPGLAPSNTHETPAKPVLDTTGTEPPQAGTTDQSEQKGDVTLSVAEPAVEYAVCLPESLPRARAREGETHGQCWDRLRREARSAGMNRREAVAYAGRVVDQVWVAPPPPREPEEPTTEDLPPSEPEQPEIDPEEPPSPAAATADQGVSGLGDLPPAWPPLPDNASLQAEIAWVSANRLRVRDGTGVNLSKASCPAPSYAALSWLETSILFPSKFADISVKATQHQEDEREHIRREKMAIEEIRGLLAEMLEG